ncbi:efflux RND transporter periplasmic adaptor subunit [Kaarinaea lacus]
MQRVDSKIVQCLFLLLACYASTVHAAPGPGERAIPVMVEKARMEFMAPQTWVAGTVISRHQAKLATEVEGKLVFVAEVGTKVKEDEAVARIDRTFVDLKIEEYKAAVERDRARLDFLKSEVQRLNRLEQQNVASKTLLEQTRADREVARNELNISRTRLQQAREEKQRHVIRAPFTGVVTDRFMRRGERAGVGDEVLELVDSQAMEIQGRVPLQTVDFVKAGDELTIKVNSEEKKARVRALVAAGDERSRLLELRLSLNENGWTIGQPVRIALPTSIAREVLVVPRDALVLRRDGTTVYRVGAENKAERVVVQTGVASGAMVEVSGDIKPGDQVVTRGGERLRPGQEVKILNAGNPANSGG